MRHTCHWTSCDKEVPPKMWGCKVHWFKLPKWIRDRIWATYKPGQEISKSPTRAYVLTALIAQKWIELADTYGEEEADKSLKEYLTEKGVLK